MGVPAQVVPPVHPVMPPLWPWMDHLPPAWLAAGRLGINSQECVTVFSSNFTQIAMLLAMAALALVLLAAQLVLLMHMMLQALVQVINLSIISRL